eukprot:TRINITY_DN2868_c0_g1_i2.p1 TRINITY_DN2868_c0_g1~~TRINITY_DN2868_c0_g1_i2.p1  ORF type:complete len:385 (-),score=165.51 TRINITY_DN2868_c0_g1_i2:30-1184(-)
MEENKELVLELIEFLSLDSKHPLQVRETALEHLAPMTTTESGRQMLKKTNLSNYLFNQLKVNSNVSSMIVKNGLTCLINLCSISDCLLQISSQEKVVSSLVENMNSSDSTIVKLSGILLNNLTHNEKGCATLLQLNEPMKKGLILSKLIEMFVFQERMEEDPHSWIASVLMNVTQLTEGRKIILDEKRGTIPLLTPFIMDQNLMRRKYILGMIKNCCFEAGSIEYLISDQVNLLVHLLMPLRAGITLNKEDVEGAFTELKNPPKSSTREKSAECRKLILKSLVMISSQKIGRQLLKDKKVYPIIREAEKIEEDEKVKEEMYTLVDIIIGEEDNPTNKNNPLVEVKEIQTKIVDESDLLKKDSKPESDQKQTTESAKQIEEIEEI